MNKVYEFLEMLITSLWRRWCSPWYNISKLDCAYWVLTTEFDKENLDSPPYLISHGQKIWSLCVLLVTHLKVADCVYATLQVWSAQWGHNMSALEVAQSYSISLCTLFGKDSNRPNFRSIADSIIIRCGVGNPSSPFLNSVVLIQRLCRSMWTQRSVS